MNNSLLSTLDFASPPVGCPDCARLLVGWSIEEVRIRPGGAVDDALAAAFGRANGNAGFSVIIEQQAAGITRYVEFDVGHAAIHLLDRSDWRCGGASPSTAERDVLRSLGWSMSGSSATLSQRIDANAQVEIVRATLAQVFGVDLTAEVVVHTVMLDRPCRQCSALGSTTGQSIGQAA